jgi:hypothetical protein
LLSDANISSVQIHLPLRDLKKDLLFFLLCLYFRLLLVKRLQCDVKG